MLHLRLILAARTSSQTGCTCVFGVPTPHSRVAILRRQKFTWATCANKRSPVPPDPTSNKFVSYTFLPPRGVRSFLNHSPGRSPQRVRYDACNAHNNSDACGLRFLRLATGRPQMSQLFSRPRHWQPCVDEPKSFAVPSKICPLPTSLHLLDSLASSNS